MPPEFPLRAEACSLPQAMAVCLVAFGNSAKNPVNPCLPAYGGLILSNTQEDYGPF